MAPMKRINYKPTLADLQPRAEKHGMAIRQMQSDNDFYMLVDTSRNFVAAPYPMTLEQVENYLDDLDEQTPFE